MEAKVTWSQGMSFSGTSGSGFTVPLGSDPSVGGQNDGFRPLELMAISLAGCTAMDVISILQKKRQDVTDYIVEISGERAEEHPRKYTAFHVHHIVHGRTVSADAVERAIELSDTKYCSVAATVRPTAEITTTYEIVEA